jgi:methionine-rich copper-binding protein CopC
MRQLASFGATAALLAALMLGRPAGVSGHSDYDHSEPTAGSTVATAPTIIKVWFTETVQLSGSSLKVTNAAGQQVDSKDVKLDPSDDDHKIVVVSLNPSLPAGTYKVAWKTISADDGDEDEGEFSFTVRAAAAAPAASPAAAAPAPAATAGLVVQVPARPAASPSPQAAPAQAPRPAASPSPQMPGSLPRTGIAEPNTPILWVVLGGLLLVVGAAVMRRARAE